MRVMDDADRYYLFMLKFARHQSGSYAQVAKAIGAPSGPAVLAWSRNGVAYKWRPAMERVYGEAYEKHRLDNLKHNVL